jgi:hypothetical protein
MSKPGLLGFVVAATALAGSGCATLAHGRAQEISIRSAPAGARVYVGSELAGETPARILVRRAEKDPIVRIEKEGFEVVEVKLTRVPSGWLLGDIGWAASQFANQGMRSGDASVAAAGVAGVTIGIDVATGSAWRLTPSEIRVMLKRVTVSDR